MSTLKIRIPKDIREAHRILVKKVSDVPSDLPLDIEVTPTNIRISDLAGAPYTLERIKFGWPGFRLETHIRKYEDGKRSIDDITVKRSKDRPKSYSNADLSDLPSWDS